MTKISRKDLVEQIIDGIFAYFKSGGINSKILAKKLIDPDLEKIKDFEQLIRIHFILQDKVVNYIKNLGDNVRKLRKRMLNVFDLKRNKIKGRIRWHRTFLLRKSKFYNDKSVFICNNPLMNFNIAENLILKKILLHIYNVFKRDLKMYEKDNYRYKWFDKWRAKRNLIQNFFKFYEKDVYLSKIDENLLTKISKRTILSVLQSRNTLYRMAASLLNEYQKLIKREYDKELLLTLLKSTLIIPDDNSTLFELFCLFKVVFIIQRTLNIKLNIISKENKEFAIFENETHKIKVFHNSTGSLNFYEKLEELNPKDYQDINYLKRLVGSKKDYYRIIKSILKAKPKEHLYSGRPDLILEIWKKESENINVLEKLYIGEIKYSDNKETFSKGLRELIEYIHFAKYKKEYLVNCDEPSRFISEELKIYGLLIVDDTKYLKVYNENIEDIEIKIFNSNTLNSFIIDLGVAIS